METVSYGHNAIGTSKRLEQARLDVNEHISKSATNEKDVFLLAILDDMWSAKECARRLGRPVQTLSRWRSAGKGPPYLRVEGRIYYRPESISRWLGEQET